VLDYVPDHFQVIRHLRPKYACCACDAITQAPAPDANTAWPRDARHARASAGIEILRSPAAVSPMRDFHARRSGTRSLHSVRLGWPGGVTSKTQGMLQDHRQIPIKSQSQRIRQHRRELKRRRSPDANQYTSIAFGSRSKDAGVRPSTGSVGDAYDNAGCGSFFATLECELLDRRRFRSHTEARMKVFHLIEGFYNPSRRHSALGYLSPIDCERRSDGMTEPAKATNRPLARVNSSSRSCHIHGLLPGAGFSQRNRNHIFVHIQSTVGDRMFQDPFPMHEARHRSSGATLENLHTVRRVAPISESGHNQTMQYQ
jgi:hypothetical protein